MVAALDQRGAELGGRFGTDPAGQRDRLDWLESFARSTAWGSTAPAPTSPD
jgi:hypothetical protein